MTSYDEAPGPALAQHAHVGSVRDAVDDITHRLRLLRARPQVSYFMVMGLTAALLVVGLVFVFSASSVRAFQDYGSSTYFLKRQAEFAVVGLIAMMVLARIPLVFMRRISGLVMIFSILALMAVPVIGAHRSGATRWIDFGPIQLQPSELAKIALILWCADLLVRKEDRLGEVSHLLIPILPVLGLVTLLVMAEPDMGTTMVIVLVVVSILWVVGTPMRIFAWLGVTLLSVGTIAALAEPYRLARLVSFRNPFHDATDQGYQAVQGFYALSSGGWWGVGLGGSREKWSGLLPNAHTDFIFAIIGEETGLIGALLVIGLFVALALTGVRIARRTADPFARLVASGITAWLVGQAIINIATVVGALPITGIPLPFISYGGTSLVLTLSAAGLLAACARTEPGAAHALSSSPGLLSRLRHRAPQRPPNVVSMPTRRAASARQPRSSSRPVPRRRTSTTTRRSR